MALTPAEAIEFFHLTLLQVMPSHLKSGRYILKGGANLRFFFGSVRYSEGIDFDVTNVDQWRLRDALNEAFAAKKLAILLRPRGVSVEEVAESKQTETTQRWKVGLRIPSQDALVRTKVEFSRRNGEQRYQLEAVASHVVEPYAMVPPTVNRYLPAAAVEQKIAALALRNETQARDVFDLDLLLRQDRSLSAGSPEPLREQAAELALSLPFSVFQDQVLPFLDPEVAEIYDRGAWSRIVDFVAGSLWEPR